MADQVLKPGFCVGGFFKHFKGAGISDLNFDEQRMQKVLIHSMESCGITAPNPAVGCMVFNQSEIVERGRTQEYRQEHAEKMALKNFSGDSSTGEIFISLEPCTHQGFQPPCIDLVNKWKWKRVVVAAPDPHSRVNGQGIEQLKKHQNVVDVGVLKNESIAWNLPFFFQQKFSRPMIIGKWAETKNGFLADKDHQAKWISGEKSREYVHWLRQKYDAILVGAKTFIHDEPLLNVRLPSPARQPLRLVWDPKEILRHNTKWLESEQYLSTGQKTLIISQTDLFRYLTSSTFVSHASELLGKPIQSILVEGGARTLRHMIEHGRLDLLHVFRSDKEFDEDSPHKSPLDIFSRPQGWSILCDNQVEGDRLVEAMPTDRFEAIF